MKKAISLLCVLTLLGLLGACASSRPLCKLPVVSEQQNAITVMDRTGKKLGSLDGRAVCTATDAGIFYSLFELPEGESAAPAEYRFFDRESGRDVRLGVLEGQGYEAVFARTELGGRLYTLAVRGNPMGSAPTPLLLLAFDPAAGEMREYTVSETGFPYAAMAAANGRLLIMNHEMTEPKRDTLYAFDPATADMRALLSFEAEKDALRGVAAAKDGFYLLRLDLRNAEGPEVFLDFYNDAGEKQTETPLTQPLTDAIMTVRGIESRADALNELGMNVSRFAVLDDRLLVYENFALSRVALDLTTGKALLARDDLTGVSLGGGSPAFYRMDFEETDTPPEILLPRGASLVRYDLTPVGDYRLLRSVSRSPGGTWLAGFVDGEEKTAARALLLWTEDA